MKKKLSILLTLALVVGITCTTCVIATEPQVPKVRVNGFLVEFPDAKPFVDKNSRTMIPVRFATEKLGAAVHWNDPTQTATISKNGIDVAVTIGSDTLQVKEKGTVKTVKMDTSAILKDGRTYVPIRFVAESLGGYVDYSDTYDTVGIYQNVLTADQIAKLRAYPYTQYENAISYKQATERMSNEDLKDKYGTDREGFLNENGYANAREYLYNWRLKTFPAKPTSNFKGLDTVFSSESRDEYYDMVVKEAIAEMTYTSDTIEYGFIADSSCVYQSDSMSNLVTTVRGIATVKRKAPVDQITGDEMVRKNLGGFNYLPLNVTATIPVDVHMATGYCGLTICILDTVPLAGQDPVATDGGTSWKN